MIFWVILIISGVFAYIGLKVGLYSMIATLFNLLFAIYAAVLSTPAVLAMSPGLETSGYYAAGTVFLLALLIFGVLQMIAYMYFLRDSEDYFPAMIDKVGAGVLGMGVGVIVMNLLMLLLCIMPLTNDNEFCENQKIESSSVKVVTWVCDRVAGYSLEIFDGDPQEIIHGLVTLTDDKSQEHRDSLDGSNIDAEESADEKVEIIEAIL